MSNMSERYCGGCCLSKPESEFYKNRSSTTGYDSRCKTCRKVLLKEWIAKNPEKRKAMKARNRAKYREKARERDRLYRLSNLADIRRKTAERTLAFHHSLRIRALQHLGGKCHRCGFEDPRALQIDHVNSDGAAERKSLSTSRILKAVIDSVPGERYQCVCANCNWIARHERGEHRGVSTGRPRTVAA